MLKAALVTTISVMTLSLAGISTAYAQDAAIPNTGFLASYAKLQPAEGMSGTYRFIDPATNLGPYTKVAIDPVQVIVNQNAEYKGLPPDVIQRMTDSFRSEFVAALQSGYQVVNAPGPDVIRIRLAITGVQAVKPDLGVTDFIPIKALFNAARSASGEAPRVAEISAEMEVLAPGGQVAGAAVSTRKADKNLPQGEQITWKDMQAISSVWAKNLRQHLDNQRGIQSR